MLKSPSKIIAQHVVKLLFVATNNEAEYEALLSSFHIALMHRAHCVAVHTDSQLVTQQISGSYQAKELRIATYLEQVQAAMSCFDEVVVQHVPRTQNAHADALARLASMTTAEIDDPITIEVVHKPRPPVEVFETH